jgi:hypothetical protein
MSEVELIQEKKRMSTFHITFSFIDNKRVTSAASLLVPHYAHPLDSSIAFKFATKISLFRAFML